MKKNRLHVFTYAVLLFLLFCGIAWAAYTDLSALRLRATVDESYLIRGYNSSGTEIFSFDTDGDVSCRNGTFTGPVTFSSTFSYLKTVNVTASTTTLTSAYSGQVIDNFGAAAPLKYTLPTWSSGLLFTVVVTTEQSTYIDPPSDSRILGITDSNGDSIWADTVGDSITLLATGSSTWTPTGYYGTWTDGN